MQWPQQWIVPHRLRADAKRRSEHLGLSSLDIYAATEEENDRDARGAGNIPKSLLYKPRKTVASMLGQTGARNRIRLDAVTQDFFEPLWELVEKNGSNSWVLGGESATTLDCWLLAYLSLASPPLKPPQNWLEDALLTKYPVLFRWATNFRQECFGSPINPASVLGDPEAGSSVSPSLSWQAQAPKSVARIGLTILTIIFDSLPMPSWWRSNQILRSSPGPDRSATRVPVYTVGLAGGSLSAMIVGCLYYFVARRKASSREFGEAGRMLGLGVH
jgi:sorting and assembly machinery component 37